jgi:hypothetical protein
MSTDLNNLPRIPDYVMACIHAYGDAREDDDGTSGNHLRHAIEELRGWAGRAAAPAGGAEPVAVPKGWKLVPVEATPQMLDAAAGASMQHLLDCIADPKKARDIGSEENVRLTHASRYRTMIAAAPTAQPQPAEYLPQTWVAAVAEECGVGVERMSCLFDFAERVQRAARLAASQPTLLNGLTDQETAASASVAGLSGAQPEAPAGPSDGRVTEEMVSAYLQANDSYWRETDELPTPPDKWRTGTPRGATFAGLRAALALATPAPAAQQPAELSIVAGRPNRDAFEVAVSQVLVRWDSELTYTVAQAVSDLMSFLYLDRKAPLGSRAIKAQGGSQ